MLTSLPLERTLRRALAASLVLAGVGLSPHVQAETFVGVVVTVRDGDTVVLKTDDGKRHAVRLNAIDAPEKGRDGRAGQPGADRSRRNLEHIARGRQAVLDSTKTDTHGRRVGLLTVETEHGPIDAGLVQVRTGLAWVYTRYLDEIPVSMRQAYREAESSARTEQRGLWRDPAPIPPWEWRRRNDRSK